VGITYDDIRRNNDLEFHPERGVGLLFMCMQSMIENQFEFIQRSWANNNDFPQPYTGIDPVIGQGENRKKPNGEDVEQKWTDIDRKKIPASFSSFVTMKGGEYFFAPSLAFFKSLIETTA
jgi:deferrochelatase/peroxidase EfeB